MHELPVVTQVLDIVLKHAEEEKAKKVISVELVIGKMHDLIPEWIEKYFAFASRGTIAEGTEVVIEQVPIICQCRKCKENFSVQLTSHPQKYCPCCGSDEFDLLTGREFELRKIEII